MLTSRTRLLVLFGLASLSLLAPLSPAAAVDVPRAPSFCPRGFVLAGAVCLEEATGDVVLPATRGEAYLRIKAAHDPMALCGAWDVHIMTQIGDFALDPAFPIEALVSAEFKRLEAQRHVRESRFAEALAVYESIFSDMEPR